MALPRRVIGITVVCSSISVRRLVEVWVTRYVEAWEGEKEGIGGPAVVITG